MGKWFVLARGVEPALGRALLALLGDDAGGVGLVGERDGEHFLGRGHLEVQRQVDLGHQPVDVAVGDMAAVLAEVRGDAVGAGLGGEDRGADRIGKVAAARVPDRRDMVDIDPEAEASRSSRGAASGLDRGDRGELGRKLVGRVSRDVDADQRDGTGTPRSACPLERSTSAGLGDDLAAGGLAPRRSPRGSTGRW